MTNASADQRVSYFIGTLQQDFYARTRSEGKKQGVDFGITMTTEVKDRTLWLHFQKEERLSVSIPLPYVEDGIEFISQNEVARALCPYWLEEEGQCLDYLQIMRRVLLDKTSGILSKGLVKPTPFIQQVVYGFINGNASIAVYRLQKAVNEVVNRMPLHETNMNSWAMNNRLMIIDPAFDEIRSPQGQLNYQVAKARRHFDKGWTALGLSDGTLADKNYLLQQDIRRQTPFGLRYHNPQRNLYSTLGMKGDELPMIMTESAAALLEQGVSRKGWNWFTCFADVPDIFEDQILVDKSHTNKFVEYHRRIQVFGHLKVKKGQKVRPCQVLGFAPDGEEVKFDVECEKAWIEKISRTTISVGGAEEPVYNVVIRYRRYFKDGFKITNMHGNKGIIRMMDLGYAIDPRTGKKRKIDVIVGGKTIGKRKNFGQVLEATSSCILEADGHESAVIPDDWQLPLEQIKAGLVRRGFNEDATWKCDTYAGKLKAVCGSVFWGCIKTPEDQIWSKNDTICRNGCEVRTAGLKLSHVEFRALDTMFGEDNGVVDEVMSYMQGTENLHEMLMMLETKRGKLPEGKPIISVDDVKPVDQKFGTIVGGQYIGGTIVDEYIMPEGFVLDLGGNYQTLLDKDDDIIHEGLTLDLNLMSPKERAEVAEQYITRWIYVPSGVLRKCWRHATGKYGLSDIGVLINKVVLMVQRYRAGLSDPAADQDLNKRLMVTAIADYYHKIAQKMGSKRGEISTHGMSVRYPYSAKAVAALSTTLPKNTIEIHRSMADQLCVTNGDVVLTERFPCLGFMSLRPQKVRVTDDPHCKYVIRVSGNSLVSQNLDFDGDVLFVASFHTKAARALLTKEVENPNPTTYKEIKWLNERKGAPHIKEFTLNDYRISPYEDLTNEEHAVIVEKNTGVKAQTGPVVALTYNIMRIAENSDLGRDHKSKVELEMFTEKAAQSVFEQKHGGKSLYEIVIDGVCTADAEMLIEVGFRRGITERLCLVVAEKAMALGVRNLRWYHQQVKERGWSNIISKIVREFNKVYFASRAKLEGIRLLKFLHSPAVDIPSKMLQWMLAGKAKNIKTELDKELDRKATCKIKSGRIRSACGSMLEAIEAFFQPQNEEVCHAQ
jgi:hypothetical protein